MALVIMAIVALAWCAWLAWDTVQECRKIDGGKQVMSGGVMSGGVVSGGIDSPTLSPTHSPTLSRLPSLSDCLEVR